MKNKFIRINIVFKIPIEVAKVAAELSLEISKKEEAIFVLDNANFYPHVTIYAPECPVDNLDEMWKRLGQLAKNFSPIKFSYSGVKSEYGYIGVGADCSQKIRNIHETIIEKINPLREDHLEEKYVDPESLDGYSGERRQNIQKYGNPDVLSLYWPHMTITRLKDREAAEKISKEIAWTIKEFTIDTIGVYMMGENGTCVELVKEFRLG